MIKTFYKKGDRVDAMSTAGEDFYIYEAYGVRADIFIENGKAEIPMVQSKNQGQGNFKKFLKELELEFSEIQFNTITNSQFADYLATQKYKENESGNYYKKIK